LATLEGPAAAQTDSTDDELRLTEVEGSDRPPLSIVVGTTEGWPSARAVLTSFRAQGEAIGAEFLIVDGTGRPPPAQEEIGPAARWLSLPETPIFQLVAVGLQEARGEVVALTEDHCTVRHGWCNAILRAHAEHPEAAAIGGAIENGSTGSLLDWASYLITQGVHMAPLGQRETPTTTNEADVSYKHWAIEDFDDNDGLGFMAILHNRALARRGARLRVDDRMVVDHFQDIGFRATSAIHFHNGKAIAGFRRQRGMNAEERLRVATSLLIPLWRTLRMFRIGWRKGRLRGTLVASLPWALWFEYMQGIGHLAGYALGPGDSPRHLR
jgi:hypothetical protein